MDTLIIKRQIYSFFQISAHRWEKIGPFSSICSKLHFPNLLHPLLIKGYRPIVPILGRFVGQTPVGFRTIEQAQGVDKGHLVLLRIETCHPTDLAGQYQIQIFLSDFQIHGDKQQEVSAQLQITITVSRKVRWKECCQCLFHTIYFVFYIRIERIQISSNELDFFLLQYPQAMNSIAGLGGYPEIAFGQGFV